MQNISPNLDAINEKIEKLIHLHRAQKEQNKLLSAQNDELLLKIKNQQQQIDQLEENFRLLKITKSLAGMQSVKDNEARTTINELVREIDKCIALLNK